MVESIRSFFMRRLSTLIFAVATLMASAPPVLSQGYPPDKAAAKMTVPEGFRVELVASEPDVRQPVAIDFDERGRLWVMQYLQYPNPAGLKRVKVDRYSRTVYDKIPEPPPKGPKGADRLTILKPDPDRPGKFKPVDFVSGLNIASGFAFGHGGVFILQAPYLLFYPDKDRDDVPDGDPEVLVTGFGMEDCHSVANSLTWGPDGWLYGCQGSTVTANIRGIEFQQGVWRYHPITRKFELFSEGGGNMWGLDFDRHGNLFCSTNVGGHVMLHSVQGAYYWKAFEKHGKLHNPYAYGYFDHVPHQNFKGGHVTVGGIVYRGDNFPAKFRDKYIAADLLGHAIYWHDIEPNGSTFKSKHGGELLIANDTWFAPSDVCLGPDGCVYVADWHDPRTAHPDPDAEWDKTNGRIYRIEYVGARSASKGFPDLAKLKSDELIKLLSHPNDWYARTARRILADRRDPEVIFPLRTLVMESKDENLQLQAFWALYVSGGFNETFAQAVLEHSNSGVRQWNVRFIGDEKLDSREFRQWLASMAIWERDLNVLSQLACTSRRLGPEAGLTVGQIVAHNGDVVADLHLPLLLWWAIESIAAVDSDLVAWNITTHEGWSRTTCETIAPRLIRKHASLTSDWAWKLIRYVIATCPDERDRVRLLNSVEQGMSEGRFEKSWQLPEKVRDYFRELWIKAPEEAAILCVLCRAGEADAERAAVKLMRNRKAATEKRLRLVAAIVHLEKSEFVDDLLALIDPNEPESIQRVALGGIQRFALRRVGIELLDTYAKMPSATKGHIRSALLSRQSWAALTLQRIDEGKFPAKDFTIDELRAVALHNDPKLDALVRKHWGNIAPATPGEKLAEVRRFNNDLRAGSGDPIKGKVHFTKHCAACHQLFNEGTKLGPDLTAANRQDRDYLLVSIVDPNAIIRKEYLSYNIDTQDGRRLSGMVVEQSPEKIVISDPKNQRTEIARNQIEAIRESPLSLMPENIIKELKPQELRDLFAYLQSKPPK
jgi:putative membrane-bound dehydrogenase-like protein